MPKSSKVVSSESQNLNQAPEGKSNRGCWILAGIGCAVFVLVVGGIVGLIAVVAALGSDLETSVDEKVIEEGSGGKIVVIDVQGVIVEESSGDIFSAGGASSAEIIDQIDRAESDSQVKGIIIKMNTPGGEVVASDLIYRELLDFRKKKKVVTWMSGMGASGGYLIAAGSDKIVAHPSTITGSIGTVLQVSNLDELYEKIGIEYRTFKSGEFKDDSGIFDEDPNGEADVIYQDIVDEAYNSFVDSIVEGRGMDRSQVETLADGRVYTGQQAKENGLVDDVGDFTDSVEVMEELVGKKNLTIVEYTSGGFWASLYDYQSSVLDRLNVLPEQNSYGLGIYYLLDM
ncbi:signal peptide peptidase SppA [Candidatus Dojkabacteria bacterium]|nr:signal peptide peptidase SppA [Candidatus Dojkabacteria bacterium]